MRFPPPPTFAREIRSVGVTGTNGKTTTVAWLATALRQRKAPVVRVTTVGSWLDDEPLGLANDHSRFLSILRTAYKKGARRAALELTSAALGAGFMRAWPCQVGVFTNLSLDHLDLHRSAEHYLASKAQLFQALPENGIAVLNASDPASQLLREVLPIGTATLSFAAHSRGQAQFEPTLEAYQVKLSPKGTSFSIRSSGKNWPATMTVRGIGTHFAENALAALLGAVAMGAPAEKAARSIAKAPPPPGRFEIVAQRPTVVVDYAHSPDALTRTLEAARQICPGKVHLIFGAGGDRAKDKRKPMGQAARPADRITITTDNPRSEDPQEIAEALAQGAGRHHALQIELKRGKAIEDALSLAQEDDLILIAGKGHESHETGQESPLGSEGFDKMSVRRWLKERRRADS